MGAVTEGTWGRESENLGLNMRFSLHTDRPGATWLEIVSGVEAGSGSSRDGAAWGRKILKMTLRESQDAIQDDIARLLACLSSFDGAQDDTLRSQ